VGNEEGFVLVAGLVLLLTAPALVPASPAAEKSAPIKVGAIFSITGASFLGVPESKTVEMLAEQINASGGVLGARSR